MTDLYITTKPGDKYRSLKWPALYEKLRARGYSKEQAARISNAQARKRHKALDALEHVATTGYSQAIIDSIASLVPELPRLKGEQLAPGVTRIRGNLCNVHGRYGPCDGGTSAIAPKPPKPSKGRKPRAAAKPKKTEAQRAQERQQQQAQNRADVLGKMNIAKDGQDALAALRSGGQADAGAIQRHGFEQAGLVERGRDGQYRLTASGRAMLSAADAGDAGRAGSTIGSARDRVATRQDRQAQADARKREAQEKRDRAVKLREQRLAKQGKRGGGGGKQRAGRATDTDAAEQRRIRFEQGQQDRADRLARQAKRDAEHDADRADRKRRQAQADERREGTDARRAARAESARYGTGSNARNLRRRKAASFQVFKDAAGQWRWVAFSSTAYRDRDGEIVSTKALEDDCRAADALGIYGPLRWWHVPGIDLGVCDFNAMHGRVLIESGTFKSERIAQNVARHAADLEISLGFLHPPTEPDAHKVFNSIRRFERSLTPRGKASNLFTSFHVKESPVMDETKKAALKALGFTDTDIADLESKAAATQKSADAAGVAYKADEPEAVEQPQEITIGGVTYQLVEKAAPAMEAAPAVVEEDAQPPDAMETEDADSNDGMTLSAEDIAACKQACYEACSQACQEMATQIMGGLDLEKKVSGHLQQFLAPYQAQKDAQQAETKQAIDQLAETVKAQGETLTELVGDQPEVRLRPSASTETVINPFLPADQQLLEAAKAQQQPAFEFGDLVTNLFGNMNNSQP